MSFQILTAEIAHETDTFSHIPIDEQAFRDGHFKIGN
jgi:microcystin degradation protein MlrC